MLKYNLILSQDNDSISYHSHLLPLNAVVRTVLSNKTVPNFSIDLNFLLVYA